MPAIRPGVRRFLRLALRRSDLAAADVDREIQFHLRERAEQLEAAGMSPEDALAEARRLFGDVSRVRAALSASAVRREAQLTRQDRLVALLDDVRYVTRSLSRSRVFSAVVVLTLALVLGANAATFSVVNAVLLKPLPFPRSAQLVALRHTAPGIGIKDLNMSPSLYFTYSDENRVFQGVGMWAQRSATVTGLAEPEGLQTLLVSDGFLAILDVRTTLGRGFTTSDHGPGSARVVILSSGYWKSRFGGDDAVLGRRITIDGDAHEVIGVLPASFQFLDHNVSLLTPLQLNRAEVPLVQFAYHGLARLKPGITLEQASADVARMIPMATEKFPPNPGFSVAMYHDARIGPNLRLLKNDLVGEIGRTLWLLLATVGIVLLIAAANVTNLVLTRANGRHHELAIRAALGAGKKRLTRELLIEGLLLGVAGGTLGLALAMAALRMLVASGTLALPRMNTIAIDSSVLAFTLVVSIVAGLCFGLIPALRYGRSPVATALRTGGRSLSQSRELRAARNALVIAQVALALVLLVSSGLMARTFRALRSVDPGFSGADQLQTLRLSIPQAQVREPERVGAIVEAIFRRVAGLPGITSVAVMNTLPLESGPNDPVYAEDHRYAEGTIPPIRRHKFVSPGYVSTAGTRLIAGRDLSWTEVTPVALVSENLAREMWKDPGAAVGKRIRPTLMAAGSSGGVLHNGWHEVIGVVADLRDDGVDRNPPAVVYWPILWRDVAGDASRVPRGIAFLIRTPRAGSTRLVEELQQAVWSVNRYLPLANVSTLQAIYDRSLARTSLTLILLSIASGMALLLGIVGVYGVVSYSVSQRTREIGIRLALGAPRQDITRLFVRHGLVLCGIGTAFGLTGAFMLTRLLQPLLFDVSAADPLTYGAALAGLAVATILASYLPARRASRVDPLESLRAE